MTWDESAERPEDPPGVVFLVPWELDKTGEALKAVTDVVEVLRRQVGPAGWHGLSLEGGDGQKALRAVVHTTRSQTLQDRRNTGVERSRVVAGTPAAAGFLRVCGAGWWQGPRLRLGCQQSRAGGWRSHP